MTTEYPPAASRRWPPATRKRLPGPSHRCSPGSANATSAGSLTSTATTPDWVNAFGSVKHGRQEIITYLRGCFSPTPTSTPDAQSDPREQHPRPHE